jgi:hypothetical protein
MAPSIFVLNIVTDVLWRSVMVKREREKQMTEAAQHVETK